MPSVALRTKEASFSTLTFGTDTKQKGVGHKPFVFFSYVMLSGKEKTYIMMYECFGRPKFLL